MGQNHKACGHCGYPINPGAANHPICVETRIANLEADLRETLRAVLHHFGPDGAKAVTDHVMASRAKHETN